MSDSRNPEFEREQQKARDGLQTVSEIRQKLDILAEHVESRKEALEDIDPALVDEILPVLGGELGKGGRKM